MKSLIKTFAIALLTVCVILPSEAQSKKKGAVQNSEWEAIMANPSYLWGIGTGETLEEADKNALSNLVSKITVAVSSNYLQEDSEMWKGSDGESNSRILNTVKTFSSATLTNTLSITLANEPDAKIGRYMKRSELSKIFEGRKTRVKEFVKYAIKSQEDNKIDDALRYYQWANVLLRSIPGASSVKEIVNGEEQTLVTWIPMQQDLILDGLKIVYDRKEGNDAVLSFSYAGRPVASLDYTCFDGNSWSNMYGAKDGVGVVELPSGVDLDRIQLRIEYQYRSQSHIDREVENVMEAVKTKAIRKAYIDVELKAAVQPVKKSAKVEEKGGDKTEYAITFLDKPVHNMDVMQKIIAAINAKNTDIVKPLFTENGFDMFSKLITYGNARILDDTRIKYYVFHKCVFARSIKMSFSFAKGTKKSFIEDVVFSFDQDGKVDCLAFALGQDELKSVLNNTYWNETTRMFIAEFLENYKTAYCLKRLDYLKTIYDDNAVIIVGHVAKKLIANPNDGVQLDELKKKEVVTRTRYSKEQYMNQLERCFDSQEFVNIRLSGNEIRKYSVGGETYGIQIKQDYYSTTYGDSGYLFLMVDLNNPGAPVIKVRTWQECSVPINELVTTTDF